MKKNVPGLIAMPLRIFVFLVFANAVMPLSCVVAGQDATLEILSENVFRQQGGEKLWQMQRSKRLKTQDEVQEYLAALNHGEFHDWRLPTRQELYDLFSIFDLKQGGDVKIRLEGNYWLSDEKDGTHVGAWEIGDQCGPSRSYFEGKAGYVRAVRP